MTTKLVTIEVTAKHIAEGERGSCKLCPVALAIREKIRPEVRLFVKHHEITIGDLAEKTQLPENAQWWIHDYDEDEGDDDGNPILMEPFLFPLQIREDFLRGGE